MPTVSVLMPVYNGGYFLHEAIESILNQTLHDFECLIVDDGSQDNTWQLLCDYAERDERVVLLRNSHNLGLIHTLNRGLAIARSRYIARMDADDIAMPERLATQVAYLEEHPEVGVVGAAYIRMFANGETSLRRPPTTDTSIRWRLLFDNVWCHPSIMFRHELVALEQPFYRDYPHIEDYELWTRLLRHTRGATLSVPLLRYRMHPRSISATHGTQQEQAVTMIAARQINTLLAEELTLAEVAALRRCWCLRQPLGSQNWTLCVRMFQLFDIFAQQPDIDGAVVDQLRRQWIQRVLMAVSPTQYAALWASGLLRAIFRYAPSVLFTASLAYLPRRALRQIVSKLGFVKHQRRVAL